MPFIIRSGQVREVTILHRASRQDSKHPAYWVRAIDGEFQNMQYADDIYPTQEDAEVVLKHGKGEK